MRPKLNWQRAHYQIPPPPPDDWRQRWSALSTYKPNPNKFLRIYTIALTFWLPPNLLSNRINCRISADDGKSEKRSSNSYRDSISKERLSLTQGKNINGRILDKLVSQSTFSYWNLNGLALLILRLNFIPFLYCAFHREAETLPNLT